MWKLKKCGGGLYSVLFRNKISFYIQPGAKNHPRKQRGKEEWIGPTENANEVNFPEALAKLTFGHDFNQSLLADDFGCLWNSCEFVCRIWPLGCEHWFVPRDICRWSDDHICLPRATKSTTFIFHWFWILLISCHFRFEACSVAEETTGLDVWTRLQSASRDAAWRTSKPDIWT